MGHYALVGNKICGMSGMAAAAERKNTQTELCAGRERTQGIMENGDINSP